MLVLAKGELLVSESQLVPLIEGRSLFFENLPELLRPEAAAALL